MVRRVGTAFLADLGERVVAVRGTLAPELPVVHVEARVAPDGELHHGEALVGGRVRIAPAVVRQTRRHEQDALEAERLRELGGEAQVAEMDRIEGPAEEAEGAGHQALGPLNRAPARRRARSTSAR